MENIPWYKSAIIRQQVVQIIVAVLTLVGVTTTIDWDFVVSVIFAVIALLVPAWTIVTRLTKPAPNLTVKAANKEAELKAEGRMPEPAPDQKTSPPPGGTA